MSISSRPISGTPISAGPIPPPASAPARRRRWSISPLVIDFDDAHPPLPPRRRHAPKATPTPAVVAPPDSGVGGGGGSGGGLLILSSRRRPKPETRPTVDHTIARAILTIAQTAHVSYLPDPQTVRVSGAAAIGARAAVHIKYVSQRQLADEDQWLIGRLMQ